MFGRGTGFRPRAVETQGGSPDARFHALIMPHLDAAYSLARYLARDAATAEDVTQETFLRAFRSFETYRDGSPRAWLFAILRNVWRDRVAEDDRRGRLIVSEGLLSEAQAETIANRPVAEQETPEGALVRQTEDNAVRTLIAQLPEPFRETLVLREIEALSYRDIAEVANVPIGTVMSRLARAREMLARLLLPADPAPEQERRA